MRDTFFGGSLHFGPFPSLQPNSPGRASARHGLGPSFWIHSGGLGGFWLPSASWGASGEAPGRSLMPKWDQLGPQNGPKLGPKSQTNRSWRILAPDRVWEIVWGDSGTILEPKMAPTCAPRWAQLGAKIAPKSVAKSIILWITLNMRF